MVGSPVAVNECCSQHAAPGIDWFINWWCEKGEGGNRDGALAWTRTMPISHSGICDVLLLYLIFFLSFSWSWSSSLSWQLHVSWQKISFFMASYLVGSKYPLVQAIDNEKGKIATSKRREEALIRWEVKSQRRQQQQHASSDFCKHYNENKKMQTTRYYYNV